MMKKIRLALASLIAVASLSVGLLTLIPVHSVAAAALDCSKPPSAGGQQGLPVCTARGGVDQAGGSGGPPLRTFIQNIISTLLFIIGIIGVIVIVIAGIQYATSGGNAEQASKAKNSIIYAVVGIIVAVMAYAIVGFVIGNI